MFTFQTLTSSGQDGTIHGCSLVNYLWVGLVSLMGVFPLFLLTLYLESFGEVFLLVQTVFSPVCSLTGAWRYWLCCLDLKTGIETLLWWDNVFLCRNSCKTFWRGLLQSLLKKRLPLGGQIFSSTSLFFSDWEIINYIKHAFTLHLRQHDPEYLTAVSKHLAFPPAFPGGANLPTHEL